MAQSGQNGKEIKTQFQNKIGLFKKDIAKKICDMFGPTGDGVVLEQLMPGLLDIDKDGED